MDLNIYPKPEWRFPNAKIGTSYEDLEADYPPKQEATEGAPNMLLVLLDGEI